MSCTYRIYHPTFGTETVTDGGNGRDTMDGGLGHDTLRGGNGNDVLRGDTDRLLVVGAQVSFEYEEGFGAAGYGLFDEVLGWHAAGEHPIELQASGLTANASDGNVVMELDSTGNSEVYRDFDVDPRMSLTVSFDFSARPGVDGDSNTIEVLWDGVVIDTVSADGTPGYYNGPNGQQGKGPEAADEAVWTTYSYEVDMDVDGTSRLTFRGIGREDSYGGLVDNVRLEGTFDGFDPETDGGNDRLEGGSGRDVLEGGAGDDLLIGGRGKDEIDGGSGDADRVDYVDSARPVEVDLSTGKGKGGDAAGDTIVNVEDAYGSLGDDTLIGDDGSNRLNGHRGDDTIEGGAGNDTLIGHDGADVLEGGAGRDTADYGASGRAVFVSLADGTGTGGHAEGDTLSGIESLVGSRRDDALTGDDGVNRLNGGGGSDVLIAGGGDDTLVGGTGSDRMEGGAGTDTAWYLNSEEGVTVSLAEGRGFTGDATGDILFDIENLMGSKEDDVLTGDDGTNRLNGDCGDDVLDGGAGDDRLVGGHGADTLIGGEGIDAVDYSGAAAGVTADLSGTLEGAGEAAGDTFEGVERLQGSDFDDVLAGDGGDNRLTGGEGDDVLLGGAGIDYLGGDAGDDVLTGGAGADVFMFREAGFGDDAVTDFEAGVGRTDRFMFRGLGVEAEDLEWVETDDGLTLMVGDEGSIFLGDMSESDFVADDFVF